MRIVHVTRQYAPAVGGMETVAEQLARHQKAEGHDVTVVTLDRLFGSSSIIVPPQSIIDGIRVVRVGFWGSQRYPLAFGVLPHLRGADLVHVHGIDFFFDFLALARPIHRRKLIATTHGGFFHTARGALLKRLWFRSVTKVSARAYSFLLACSAQDRDLFASLDHPGLRLIENGVDTEKYRDLAAERSKTIIYFGRWAPNKGLDQLMRWFAAIHTADGEWRLIIAGRPAGVSGESLRKLADELGVSHSVMLVPDVAEARLKRLIRQASVFASASRFEGFGIAAIEAASAGLMPVLSPIPPFAQLAARLGHGHVTRFEATSDEADRFLNAWREWGLTARRSLVSAAVQEFGWAGAANAYAALQHALYPPSRPICGVDVSAMPKADALQQVYAGIEEARPSLITFCNAHTANVARSDQGMKDALEGALVLNDGIGVDIASRLLFGAAFPENLNGTDFTPAILQEAPRPLRLFLLGGEPGIAERAARRLAAEFPQHFIVGVHHGFFSDAESAAVVRTIRDAAPDLVLVGMGQPRQEVWAAKHLRSISATCLCVGAFLDFTAGVVPRAPALIRKWRLEWMYRLWCEPRRLARRYVYGNISFLAAVARQRRRVPWHPALAGASRDREGEGLLSPASGTELLPVSTYESPVRS